MNLHYKIDKIFIACSIFIIQIFLFLEFSKNFNIFVSFILVIVVLYIIYLLSRIIHLIICKLLLKIKLTYIVIYPFTFYKSISFVPIKLLYFPECVRDLAIINTFLQLLDEKKAHIKFKNILFSIVVSRIISIIILYHFLFRFISIYTIIIIFIFSIVQSFFGKNSVWMGNICIHISKKIEEVVLTKSYIQTLDKSRYERFLLKDNDLSDEILLSILENYSDNIEHSIIDTSTFCTIMNKYIPILLKKRYQKSILLFIRTVFLIYRIGIIGVLTSNKEIILLSNHFCNEYLFDLNTPHLYAYQEDIIRFKDYLNNGKSINLEKYKLKKIHLFN